MQYVLQAFIRKLLNPQFKDMNRKDIMNANEIGIAEVGFVRKYIEAKSRDVSHLCALCRLKCFLNPKF